MKGLIGCEKSGVVRRAFLERGYDVWSCDIERAEDGSNRHIVGDVRDHLNDGWDFLFIAHPPCFVAGTLVLTKRGHVPIEDVVVGDLVLTHRGRWRRVKETMHKRSDELLSVKSTNALPIVTTPEHPFYVRYRAPYANGFRTKAERDGEARFVDAGDLSLRHFTGSVLPPTTAADVSDDDLWLMGRYVADGHMRRSRWTDGKWEEMNLAVGAHELEAFRRDCPRKCSIAWNGTAYRATFYGHDAISPFAQFGLYAHQKFLPAWVLELPAEQAKAFLNGYLSGDGYHRDRDTSAATVSPRLALGVAVLMQRVFGKCPRILVSARKPTVVIEGRTVTQRASINVSVGNSDVRLRNYVDGEYAWGHVRKIGRRTRSETVFNLAVEEDETYTANGVIVHNCTRLCNSGVRWLHVPPPGRTIDDMQAELRAGADLFSDCWNAPVDMIAIENPVMHRHAKALIRNFQPHAQSVQPWQFGDPEAKRTCFWLKGLPPLVPTHHEKPADIAHRVWRMPPGPDRARERSRFFPGIAAAMADQWGAAATARLAA